MTDRATAIEGFVSRAGWADAVRRPLAGDASTRRYERLSQPDGRTTVLMDAGGDGAGTTRFCRIARHLQGLGLTAPTILAEDHGAGLLLLEDLGDAVFARVLDRDRSGESRLYSSAIDALAAMATAPVPGDLPVFRAPQLVATAAAAVGWYPGVSETAGQSILGALAESLAPLDAVPRRLCLRDFHAENLIWLPERKGVQRAGILDFQDAVAGHPAYDLVSLLTDARRDVAPATRTEMTARFLAAAGLDPARFAADFATLSAQRNLRILTQFARLAIRDGKPGYLPLMPRVWGNLILALEHPDLARLKAEVAAAIRPPDTTVLAEIRAACVPS
ncbi:aminoglycoside phosphotransferase family protein [Palleronia sp. KMU-117]|uniref:aminoglycoside phosphotransferase family protein n=1 Tax=Palleronia sp. KMU-117 TaxID=3434108 RepID=UPI003D7466DB